MNERCKYQINFHTLNNKCIDSYSSTSNISSNNDSKYNDKKNEWPEFNGLISIRIISVFTFWDL